MWKPRKICCEKTINESNERTFERSTILRNNSHQTKSKSCVEWTMKVSVLVCCCCCLLLAVLHSASVCISLFIGHTRTFKHSLDVLCVVFVLCFPYVSFRLYSCPLCNACVLVHASHFVECCICAMFRGQFDVLLKPVWFFSSLFLSLFSFYIAAVERLLLLRL